MKKKAFLPLLAIAAFVLIVSCACGFSIGKNSDETDTPEETEVVQEPQVIVVTATPEAKSSKPTEAATENPTEVTSEAEVTEEASTEALPYFLEEWDGSLENYSYDTWGPGDEELVDIYQEDGQLKFDIEGEQNYPYVFYDAYTYTDVRIDVEVENIASNDNSVNLVCRYDEDLGWYEYNIDNDGEWTLWYHDNVVANDYVMLYDGGSTAINMGRDTNTYTMICQGREISLYINGVHTKTFEHKDLKEGYVAIGASSYYSYPVKLNFNWMEISEP